MFTGCTNLTSFNSDLSGLGYGNGMFELCPLDEPSIRRILTGKDENGNDIIGKISGKPVSISGGPAARPVRPGGYMMLTLCIGSQDAYDTLVEITGWDGTGQAIYGSWILTIWVPQDFEA